jgi:phage terminase small subunit
LPKQARKPTATPSAKHQAGDRYQRFADEYVKDLNGPVAAIAAGYSERTAPQQASRLLANPKVKALIAARQAKISEKTGITVERVVNELAKIGFANAGDFFRVTKNGEPAVDFSSLTDDQKAAIAEVTVEDFTEGRGEDAREVRRIRYKLHDKIGALVKLGQHLGMWKNLGPKVVNNTVNLTVNQRIEAVDAEFMEIVGSVDPVALEAPAKSSRRH